MRPSYTTGQRLFLKLIGNNIRKLRQLKSLSQEGLAEVADLDRTYVSSVERGERNVSAINLKKIADALEVAPAQLFFISKRTIKAKSK